MIHRYHNRGVTYKLIFSISQIVCPGIDRYIRHLVTYELAIINGNHAKGRRKVFLYG